MSDGKADFEDAFDGPFDDHDCWNCGGEGFVADCQQEFACLNPEDGCDLCMSRCEYCNPPNRTHPTQGVRND